MTVALLAARSDNDVIGRGGDIPWHLSADLKHFQRLTTGHTIVMGRKTFESIGRALPDRRTIVVTRNPDFTGEDIVVAGSLDEAIRLALEEPFEPAGEEVEVFVVGGGEIYRQALGRADRMYLTRVHTVVEGDVTFPAFAETDWECTDMEWHAADERNPVDYTFETWERK